MVWGVFWEDTKGRERNQSRRKLHVRRGLISNTSMRSTNGKTITPPLSLVKDNYALGHHYRNRADTLSFSSNFIYTI